MRVAAGVVSCVVSAILLAACGIPTDDKPRTIPSDQVPFDLLATSTTSPATTAQPQTESIDVYLIRDAKLTTMKRNVAAPPTVGSALAALIQGPRADTEPGLTSAVKSTEVQGAQVSASVATVSVTPAFAQRPLEEKIWALAQIVYTATAISDVESVQVVSDNSPIDVPRGDGSETRGLLKRSDYAKLAP